MFVALDIQHAMRMCHSHTVACPALQYFFILSYKRHDLLREKIVTERKMFVSIFSKAFV